MRSRLIALSILTLTVVTTANAQPFGQRGGDRPAPPTPEEIRDLMVIELDMDAAQASELDAIYETHQDALLEGRAAMESARELRQQMHDARMNGDDEEVNRIRGELRAAFESGRTAYTAFMDDVETILTTDQQERLGEILPGPGGRGRGAGRGPRGMGRGGDPIEHFNNAIAEIDLTSEQEAQVDALMGQMEPKIAERMQQWENLRPLFEEMREAREAGDDARVQELRDQIRESRPERGDLRREVVGQLEEILTEEQMVELRAKMEAGRGGNRGGQARGGRDANGSADLREIMRVLRMLDLTPEQRTDIRSAMQATRQAAAQERDTQRQQHFDDLVVAIKTVLTPEQTEIFDAEIAKLQSRQAERRDRRPRERGAADRGQRGERRENRRNRGNADTGVE
jgi:Spy/CpxP family protein refolding chaperone